jgi:hypothetical protein
MSVYVKLVIFTFFTAFIVGFILCGESHATPGFFGTDEHGRDVNVTDVDKYLKHNPYKPPVKKKPSPPKTAKKPAHKPVPKPKYEYSIKDAVGIAVGGSVGNPITTKIKDGKKATGKTLKKAGLAGAVGGIGVYTAKWAYDNNEYIGEKFLEFEETRATRIEKDMRKKIASGDIYAE